MEARRKEVANNLKQVGKALDAYHAKQADRANVAQEPALARHSPMADTEAESDVVEQQPSSVNGMAATRPNR